MKDLHAKVKALGKGTPRRVFLLRTLGLGLLSQSRREAFLQRPDVHSFPVLHDAAFWEPLIEQETLLEGMTIVQVQSQTKKLAYMVDHLAFQRQTALRQAPDIAFSPLQNSYLLLVALGMDGFPAGALRPFEPWDMVEMRSVGLLINLPDRTLSDAEQSYLATALGRQYHEIRSVLPIACTEVDLCVNSGLFPIFSKMSDEQQDRVVTRNGRFFDFFPVFRKSRHRTPFFLYSLHLEVYNNTNKPIIDLFLWLSQPCGIEMKNYLMQRFQDSDITPVEMCLVLAVLASISEINELGECHTTRRNLPGIVQPRYERPTISEFYEWTQQPSDLHRNWGVIETLMRSFEEVFSPPWTEPAVPAMRQLFDPLKPAVELPEVRWEYLTYWSQRRLDILNAGCAMEKVDLKTDLRVESEKDLMDATNYRYTRGQDAYHSLDDLEPTESMECVQEPPPIYRPCSLSDSKNGKRDLVRRNRNITKISWHHWILRAFPSI